MKILNICYSKNVPTYNMDVEAEDMSEAVDKAKNIIYDEKGIEVDIWHVEEKVELTTSDKR